jgi:hypothetical protein
MLKFLRQNAIALLALFVALGGTGAYAANTIFSTDIVDGEVKTPDLATGAVTGLKIADGTVSWSDLTSTAVTTTRIKDGSVLGVDMTADTLTGTQIKESTLGQVPDSAALGGTPAADYGQYTHSTFVATSDCVTQIQLWTGCAPITVNIPSNHTYVVTVTSTVNAFSAQTQTLGFCAASAGPQCFYYNSAPELLTAWGGAYTVGTSTATQYIAGPQTFVAQTAIKLGAALNASPNAKTTTTVTYYDLNDEHG